MRFIPVLMRRKRTSLFYKLLKIAAFPRSGYRTMKASESEGPEMLGMPTCNAGSESKLSRFPHCFSPSRSAQLGMPEVRLAKFPVPDVWMFVIEVQMKLSRKPSNHLQCRRRALLASGHGFAASRAHRFDGTRVLIVSNDQFRHTLRRRAFKACSGSSFSAAGPD